MKEIYISYTWSMKISIEWKMICVNMLYGICNFTVFFLFKFHQDIPSIFEKWIQNRRKVPLSWRDLRIFSPLEWERSFCVTISGSCNIWSQTFRPLFLASMGAKISHTVILQNFCDRNFSPTWGPFQSRVNFNRSKIKSLHPLESMRWNHSSIPKFRRNNRWSLGMDTLYHPTYY